MTKDYNRVVVLNQFAMPRTHWGLTRNAELFGRLDDWDPLIVSGATDHYAQERLETTDPLFRLVAIPAYKGSAKRRVLGWMVFAIKSFAITVRQKELAVVFASSPHLLAAVAGAVAARVRRVPFVMEVRDLWPESIVEAGMLTRGSRLHRLLVWLERRLYAEAETVIVVTRGWEDHFLELGVPLGKVMVIGNGVDVESMSVAEDRDALRAEFGFSPDRLVAVYAGAHGPANGLDQLIAAATATPNVDFVLIGAGAEKASLQEQVRREGVDNVRFLDPVPKNELARLLAAADVGVHVLAPWDLLQKGLSPNKVLDYMAAGLPVVSNSAKGLEWVVRDNEAGRLGPTDSLTSMIKAAAEADPAQRQRWAQAGRSIVAERFSRAAAAANLGDVLDKARSRPRD